MTVKKWVAWIDYHDEVVTDEIEFVETPKMLKVVGDDRHSGIGYSKQVRKDDVRLKDTREAAIEVCIDTEKMILADCQKRVNKANGRITLLRKAMADGK
ncbi:MAG: hypothetical protein ACYS7Y_04310 [Planctomycetota bacterium]|jgi:hypothetical protein